VIHYALQAFVLLAFAAGLFIVCWGLWVGALILGERIEDARRNSRRIKHQPRSQFQSQTTPIERKL
jgi:hypothetical protein